MASERLTFRLEGRDDLSRVLGHAGESAERLRATMEDAADGSGRAILTLTQDADGRLHDMEGRFVSTADAAALLGTRAGESGRRITTWADAADRAGEAGEALGKAIATLAPAAIPAAASLAPIAPAILGAAAAAGVFGLALGGQISAMGDATEAEDKYNEAVEESGKNSAEAAKAQDAYARQMAKLPEPTRRAAASLSVLKDEYADWSDELADFTMEPVIHGLATTQAILPKLTPMVKGFALELDRTVTIAAGGVASPGFDAFMERMGDFSAGVMDRVNDSLLTFLRTLDTDDVGSGVSEFMAWAREQGPTVREIFANLGETLINLIDASADMGVTMLDVVAALTELLAAVPPDLIATLLQLAIAIKAVTLATTTIAAARAAIGALATQLIAMRTAAAGAPGPLAAAGAAISALSRTAKIALLGSGIGILAVVIGEIAAAGEDAPIDLDKLTLSLAKLGDSGKLTGEALKQFGAGFEELDKLIGEVVDPSVVESINNWGADITGGFLDAGAATEEFTEKVDVIDKALAQLVSAGNGDLAAASLQHMLDSMDPRRADKLRSSLDDYDTALENAVFEQKLAAQAMGVFGAQAQETQEKLDEQKRSADGLRQAIFALNETNRDAVSAMADFEGAIDAATKAIEDNGRSLKYTNGELDLGSDKARKNFRALNDLAGKAEAAAAAAIEQGRSQAYANGILDRGRDELIKVARQMGLNTDEAKKLADQILRTPDKTARLKGDLSDLERKLNTAKDKLKKVPDSKKAAIRAEISQLEKAIAQARIKLNSLDGMTVHTYIVTEQRITQTQTGESHRQGKVGHYATGGQIGRPGGGGMVRGPGTGTSDSILAYVSAGEYVIRAAAVDRYGVGLFDALNSELVGTARDPGRVLAGMPARQVRPGRAAAPATGATITANIKITDAMDPVRVGQEVQRVLLRLKRTNGRDGDLGVG